MRLRQHLPGHRQHRRIAEMEQHHRGEEDDQVPPSQQVSERNWLAFVGRIFTAPRLLVVDLFRVDQGDNRGAGHREGANQVKDPMVTERLAQRPGQNRGQQIATMVEALVTADPSIEQPPADQSQRQRGDRRAGSPPKPRRASPAPR